MFWMMMMMMMMMMILIMLASREANLSQGMQVQFQSNSDDTASYVIRGADCDTDHYLVVAKVMERLAVSKQAAQKFDGERFNMRKLNELEVKKKYQITNRFAALENLNVDEDVNRA
jgi:hypothetical protein